MTHLAYPELSQSALFVMQPEGSPNFRWLMRKDGVIVLQHLEPAFTEDDRGYLVHTHEWRDIPTVREIDIEGRMAA